MAPWCTFPIHISLHRDRIKTFPTIRMTTIATENIRDRNTRSERKHRLNREIHVPEVRLLDPDNNPLGIVSLSEALHKAYDLDVDLVEISPTATPPVCRLMDYGKFKYQEQKRADEAKAKQAVVDIKEVKFRPSTDVGDFEIKMRNVRRFLAEGDKCKITLRFRGREITHQDIGMAQMARIKEELGDAAIVEQNAKLDGRQLTMMLAPGKRKP